MKWSFIFLGILLSFLTSCQNIPAFFSANNSQKKPSKVEQLVNYGAVFAFEYRRVPEATCKKYRQDYQQGDWRAGWVLALHANETKTEHCLNRKQALTILIKLEADKVIYPELLWLTHVHVEWINALQKEENSNNWLKREIDRKRARMTELENANQDLEAKLEALKAIETSINQ